MEKEGEILYNKRGQFYLMVSMIIIAVIVGLISVHNMARGKPVAKISHLENELEIESEYVLDYHLNTNQEVLDKFTRNYSDYLGEGSNIIYILENETDDLEVFEYNSSTGDRRDINYFLESEEIKVPVDSTNYTFELRDGKDFYFIITKENFGEKHVVTNQN